MSTNYPGTIQTFTNPAGTTLVTDVDHAGLHSNVNDTIAAIENVLGTTAGTSVLKDFSAGQFPIRVNSGGTLMQTVTGGTINNTTIGTPSITGGTLNNVSVSNGTADATGDLYYRGTSGTLTRLAIGTNGQYLTTNGTTPSWGSVTQGAGGLGTLGWGTTSDTWSYVSGTQIRAAGTHNTYLDVGYKIKIIQGGTIEYYYIIGTAIASGSTTLTVLGDVGTPVVNTTISSFAYSNIENAYGFPDWFTYTPTITGNTNMVYTLGSVYLSKFSIHGRMATYLLAALGSLSGTMDAAITHVVPIAPADNVGYAISTGGWGYDGGHLLVCSRWDNVQGKNFVFKYNGSTWGTGDQKYFSVCMNYKI